MKYQYRVRVLDKVGPMPRGYRYFKTKKQAEDYIDRVTEYGTDTRYIDLTFEIKRVKKRSWSKI